MPGTLSRDRAARRRDERGIALPSVVTVLSIVAVAAAAVAFFVTVGHSHHSPDAAGRRPPASTGSPTTAPSSPVTSASTTVVTSGVPSSRPKPSSTAKPPAKPRHHRVAVDRGSVSVVVFNDSPVTGLASSVGSQVNALGWRFVGASNWSGPVPSSTVYYPPRLQAAAERLAHDLHIGRVRPAQLPAMASDRLTVILTGRLG